MEFYVITGSTNNLIKSYLHDRFQRERTDHDSRQYTPDWEPVKDGVPQCFILGPLVFLLHINVLPKTISDISNPIVFVDDTSMIITNSDPLMFKRDMLLYN